MGNECASESCSAQGSSEESSPASRRGCPCGTPGCSGDPIDCATGMWGCAFFQALKQTQVDLLKGKIQKAWGAKMDKAADIILEAMGVKWQAMLAEAKAKADVREQLAHLWQEGHK